MKSTIFERYGGFSSVSRVVMSFYEKMLDSPDTAHYFNDIDMKRLIDHQTKFIAAMMGGPASYTNEHLERVHAHLGITEDAFMESLVLMRDTLEEYNFADQDIRAVENEMMSRKNFVVARR
jgi:hemoglobin